MRRESSRRAQTTRIPSSPSFTSLRTGRRFDADAVGEFTVFNIGGNKYRLATYINYRTGKVYIRHVMTHEEYSKEDWKKR